MASVSAGVLSFVAFFSISFGQTAQPLATKPPVEAFGSLPAFSDAVFAPDGKHLAALQAYKGRRVVVIYDLTAPAGTIPSILADDTHDIIDIAWARNDRLLVILHESAKTDAYSFMEKQFSFYRTISIDAKAQNLTFLFKRSPAADHNSATVAVTDFNMQDPTHIVMPLLNLHNDSYVATDLFKVDVVTGRAEIWLEGSKHTIDWITDGRGTPVARIKRTEDPLVDHLELLQDGRWNEVSSYDAEADNGAALAGLTLDGKAIVRFATDPKTKTRALMTYDLATGKTAPLFVDPKYDVNALMVTDWERRANAAVYTDDVRRIVYFNSKHIALQKGLQAVFPDSNTEIWSETLALDKAIIIVTSSRHSPAYYLLDRTTHQAKRIGESYPKLHPEDLGEVKPYPYKARDGLDIPAYLTLPPGKQPHALPVVVMPHGGPQTRDSMDFHWWAQFLANRGYAVLQPNYRGSDGYGRTFLEAGYHQWGLKIQDDITDGVKKLIADGIADPKRVCIVGASYGGYTALAGATLTPDLYACAVSYAGISDLPLLLKEETDCVGHHSKSANELDKMVGLSSKDLPRLKATSPVFHADQVKIPVLLMHSDGDTTVPINQSVEMADALQKAGKKYQFIKFKGEDHYLELADTRIRMLSEIETFLKANIGE